MVNSEQHKNTKVYTEQNIADMHTRAIMHAQQPVDLQQKIASIIHQSKRA